MKLRMKVFTDSATGRRYLVSMALFQPESTLVQVFLMSDEETSHITISIKAYNSLPYFFFEECGPAERPPMRIAQPLHGN